ncbi:DUF6794 domain-containing protein [Chryseolinea sp. T2]|uniref:DUF6794 domain-containing protein n=1 Tax=Chryseolinea sp. T2 TaxID=3129255 RepID=UPI003078198C
MKPSSILLLLISVLTIACSKDEPPKDLNESIAYFEENWSPGQLREFQLKDEETAVTGLHTTVGMWIRNNWILGDRNPPLIRFFDSLHFRHPDDISSTILTSLHRKLNNKDIDLQGQIADHEAYWKPIVECEEQLQNAAVELNNRLQVGDTLILLFPVDNSDNDRNAFVHACPDNEWIFDENKDLRVEGIVTRKFNIGSPTNYFIDYNVISMNDENTRILMEKVALGDTIDFQLNILTVPEN